MRHKRTFFLLCLSLATFLAFGQQKESSPNVLFEKAKFAMETKGDLKEAIRLFNEIIEKYPQAREAAAKSQLYLGLCFEKQGLKEAEEAFQKVIANYPEQAEAVKAAKEKLSVILRAQAVVEKSDREYKITRILTDPEKTNLAFISPDGGKLAIAGLDGEIWVRDIAAAKDTRLTQTPGYEYWCFWSPDSERIAYLDFLNGLHIVSAKGGEPITLIKADSDFIKSGKFAWPVGWTPDGKMIVCLVSGRGLCAIPFDGGAWRDLFKFSSPDQAKEFTSVALSPDNTQIAYSSYKSGHGDIYIVPVTGGRPVQVTDHPASELWPTWSFDGKWLAFFSGRSGENEIWLVKISPEGKPEGEPFQVSQGGAGRNCFFSWTKNGKIGISKNPIVSNIYVADLDSGKQTQLTKMLTNDQSPRWSPDGTRMAYISEKAGKRDLWLIPSGGGEPELITGSFSAREGVQFISSPCWLPDGKSIAFVVFVGDERNLGIWVIPAQGGEAKKIKFTFEGSIQRMDWSPDGKKIAFNYLGIKDDKTIKGSRTFENDIYVVPAEGGEPIRITQIEKEGLSFDFPRWSPDRKKIAFWSEDWFESNQGKESNQIWVADLERGKAEPITKKFFMASRGLGWAPDGKSIVFSIFENDKDQLFSVPSAGGELKKLNIEGTFPEYSPDGKKIVYMKSSKTVHEFWLVENFRREENNSKKK